MKKYIVTLFLVLGAAVSINAAVAEKCHYCDFSDEPIVVTPKKPAQAKKPQLSVKTGQMKLKTGSTADGSALTPWQEFCLNTSSAEDYADCEAGIPAK